MSIMPQTREQFRAARGLQKIGKFIKPQTIFIGDAAKKLYALERKRSELLQEIAKEHLKVTGHSEEELYTRGIPQVLFDYMQNVEVGAAVMACEAVLEMYGYSVTRPEYTQIDNNGKPIAA